MAEAIRTLEQAALRRFEQEAAFVEGPDGSGWRVRLRDRVCTAERAASCLVEPRRGDKVLLAISEGGQEAYVLSILTRAERDAGTRVSVDGDLSITSQGRLELAAAKGLRLLTPAELEAGAQSLKLRAADARLAIDSMAYLGRELVAHVKATKLNGGMLDAVFGTVVQKAKRVYRTVTEAEQVRAENYDVRCDNALMLHGENAAMTATKLLKMDSAQIVMG